MITVRINNRKEVRIMHSVSPESVTRCPVQNQFVPSHVMSEPLGLEHLQRLIELLQDIQNDS